MVRLIPRDVANQIVGMAAASMQYQAIAARYGVHRNSIRNILRRHQRTGDVRHRPVTGRPRVTTPAQDHFIRTVHLRLRIIIYDFGLVLVSDDIIIFID